MYAGETTRGFAYLGGVAGILAVGALFFAGDCIDDTNDGRGPSEYGCSSSDTISGITTVALLGVWGWSIHDAGRAANRWNVRHGHPISALIVAPIVPSRAGGAGPGARIGLRIALP